MTPDSPYALKDQFRSLRREMRILIGTGFLMLAIMFVVGYLDSRNQRHDIRSVAAQAQTTAIEGKATANQTHIALCSVKADYQRRVQATKDYIAAHPDGVDGISRSDLDRSLVNLKSTVDSLSALRCQKPRS